MKKTRMNIKESLMIEAEKIIDELMDWNEEVKEPTFKEIEDKVMKLRRELSEKMVEGVTQIQEKVRPVFELGCKKCGKEMEYRGWYKKKVNSWVGKVALERGYYYCDHCKGGLFPPR